MKRLSSLDDVLPDIRRPKCGPRRLGSGIVHVGAGEFHRTHQTVYTDDALEAEGGDWRIIGASLRNVRSPRQ